MVLYLSFEEVTSFVFLRRFVIARKIGNDKLLFQADALLLQVAL
jgi:hypothetical protein